MNINTSIDSIRSIDLNFRIEFVFGRILVFMLLSINICTSMACKAPFVLAVSCIMVIPAVILIMIALSSTLVIILRRSLPISTDTRILMNINIRLKCIKLCIGMHILYYYSCLS